MDPKHFTSKFQAHARMIVPMLTGLSQGLPYIRVAARVTAVRAIGAYASAPIQPTGQREASA